MDTEFFYDDGLFQEISDKGGAEVFEESELASLNGEESIRLAEFAVSFRKEVEADEFGASGDRKRVGEGRAREAYGSEDGVVIGVSEGGPDG